MGFAKPDKIVKGKNKITIFLHNHSQFLVNLDEARCLLLRKGKMINYLCVSFFVSINE